MGIVLPNKEVNSLYIGTTEVEKLYLGGSSVYQKTSPVPPSGYTELNNNVVLLAHLNNNTTAQTSGNYIDSYEFNNRIDSTDSKFLTGSMSCIGDYSVSSDPYSITTAVCSQMEDFGDVASQSLQPVSLAECWVKNQGYELEDGEPWYWESQQMLCVDTTYDGGDWGFYIELEVEDPYTNATLVASPDVGQEVVLDANYHTHYQDWVHLGLLQVGQSMYACYNGRLFLLSTANRNLTPTRYFIIGDDTRPAAKFCEFRISLANNLCNCDFTNMTYTVPTHSFTSISQ